MTANYFDTIELNLTELCNMQCTFCPRSANYPNQNKHMSLDVVEKLLGDIESWGRHFNIFIAGRGEPTLHNNFGELLTTLIDFRDRTNLIHIGLHTNGKRFDKYSNVLSRLDGVTYSIYDETPNPEDTIKKYKLLNNVLVKDKRTATTTKKFTNRSGSVTQPDKLAMPKISSKQELFCIKPFHVVYVDLNGDFNLCCDDWKEKVVLGNIFEESLQEYATNSAALQMYQYQLSKLNRTMSPCSTCDRLFSGHKLTIGMYEEVTGRRYV